MVTEKFASAKRARPLVQSNCIQVRPSMQLSSQLYSSSLGYFSVPSAKEPCPLPLPEAVLQTRATRRGRAHAGCRCHAAHRSPEAPDPETACAHESEPGLNGPLDPAESLVRCPHTESRARHEEKILHTPTGSDRVQCFFGVKTYGTLALAAAWKVPHCTSGASMRNVST